MRSNNRICKASAIQIVKKAANRQKAIFAFDDWRHLL